MTDDETTREPSVRCRHCGARGHDDTGPGPGPLCGPEEQQPGDETTRERSERRLLDWPAGQWRHIFEEEQAEAIATVLAEELDRLRGTVSEETGRVREVMSNPPADNETFARLWSSTWREALDVIEAAEAYHKWCTGHYEQGDGNGLFEALTVALGRYHEAVRRWEASDGD